jgi:hypothetical protein
VWLAAGGHAFRTHVHLAPLFEAMVIGEPVSLDKVGVDCPNRDAHCVHRALEPTPLVGAGRGEARRRPMSPDTHTLTVIGVGARPDGSALAPVTTGSA